MFRVLLSAVAMAAATGAHASFVTLYDQNFEEPNDPPGFVNGFSPGSGYDDVSQQLVNDLYGGQPSGFFFAQSFTVETLLLTGTEAFGSGFNDPTGTGGTYALGMLGSAQNDRLGLSFDVGAFDFFNFALDVSSIGISGGSGSPFTRPTDVPTFTFRLYDNPSGIPGVSGNDTLLDEGSLTGTASHLDTFDWTRGTFAFDASGSTNGNVTLQIDLTAGAYAAFDNFLITASNTPGGGLTPVPVPPALPLLAAAVIGLGALSRRRA